MGQNKLLTNKIQSTVQPGRNTSLGPTQKDGSDVDERLISSTSGEAPILQKQMQLMDVL